MDGGSMDLSMDALGTSLWSIDLSAGGLLPGVGGVDEDAEAELSPARMAELERLFASEGGGAAPSPPPALAPAAAPPPPLAGPALPDDDCLLQIFRCLPPWPHLVAAAQVCRKFRRVILRARGLWAHLVLAADDCLGGSPCAPTDGLLEFLARRAGPALQSLTVRGCDGLTPAGLGAVAAHCGAGQLATVELSDCSWVGLEPLLGLLACPGLRHLAVSGCRGPAPSGTPPQPPSRLTHLKLDDTRLSVPELQYLLQQLCPALEHLEIFSAPKAVAGALVDVVAAAEVGQLRVLQLGETAGRSGHWAESSMMTDSSLDAFGSMTAALDEGGLLRGALSAVDDRAVHGLLQRCSAGAHVLTFLELAGFHGLTGSALEALPTSVTQLSLRGCSGLSSLPLPRCTGLLALDLADCCGLTDSALITVGRQCPQLVELNCEGCEQLTDAAVAGAVEAGGFQCLQRLNARGCPAVTSAGVSSWACAAPRPRLAHLVVGFDSGSVRSLNLPPPVGAPMPADGIGASGGAEDNQVWRWLAPFDDAGLAALSGCPLAVLDASGCRLTGGATAALAGAAAGEASVASCSLQELRLSSCPGLAGLTRFHQCPALASVTLTACQSLGDADLALLVEGCPALRYLCIDDCQRITGQGVGAVGARCRVLDALCLSQCGGLRDDVTFADIPTLRQLSIFDCANITAISALAMIVACGSLWRAQGSVRIDRCQHLGALKASLPRALLASVLSFSQGDGAGAEAGGGELVPLIVQAMARLAG